MIKTIDTLVEDIYSVISDRNGWDEVVNDYFTDTLHATMWSRLREQTEEEESKHKGTLRMSSIGQPCARKLWYSVNKYEEGEVLLPHTQLKFLYGDILEDLLLSLAVAAGHSVEGRQDEMSIRGVKGHRDAVIDGVTVDVKSASTYSFKKFKEHKLEEDDPFGYLSQLSSYVYAAKDEPIVKEKNKGAFLVVDKQHGHLCLDIYDFKKTGHLGKVDKLYKERIEQSGKAEPPARGFEPEPEGKSGNMKLGVNCSYCDHKHSCHEGLRTFAYWKGPVFLTHVAKKPNVPEIG
jgi:hypothetical protein